MASTPTTVPTPTPTRTWSVKHYTILVALVLALAAGMFAVYSMTGSDVATTAPSTDQIEAERAGGGCSANSTVGGGLVEGQSSGDTCGAAGGSGIRGGVQP